MLTGPTRLNASSLSDARAAYPEVTSEETADEFLGTLKTLTASLSDGTDLRVEADITRAEFSHTVRVALHGEGAEPRPVGRIPTASGEIHVRSAADSGRWAIGSFR